MASLLFRSFSRSWDSTGTRDVRGVTFDVVLLGDVVYNQIGSWPDKEISRLKPILAHNVKGWRSCLMNPGTQAWTYCRQLDNGEVRGDAGTFSPNAVIAVLCCCGLGGPDGTRASEGLVLRIYSQSKVGEALICTRDCHMGNPIDGGWESALFGR